MEIEKEMVHEVARDDKHYLRKYTDLKAQIGKVSGSWFCFHQNPSTVASMK